jgi:hypothetical protein
VDGVEFQEAVIRFHNWIASPAGGGTPQDGYLDERSIVHVQSAAESRLSAPGFLKRNRLPLWGLSKKLRSILRLSAHIGI